MAPKEATRNMKSCRGDMAVVVWGVDRRATSLRVKRLTHTTPHMTATKLLRTCWPVWMPVSRKHSTVMLSAAWRREMKLCRRLGTVAGSFPWEPCHLAKYPMTPSLWAFVWLGCCIYV